MTYEEFLDTELRHELANIHYEPEARIVYGKVHTGFNYRSEYYSSGWQIAYHLDTGIIRVVHLV